MRRALLLLALLFVVGCGGDEQAEPDGAAMLRRAAGWLWVRQADDGGWISETYGLLRSGQSLTPFVLDALLDVPVSLRPRDDDALRRAAAFIAERVDADGALGRADEHVDDYPNYATALGLRVLRRLGGHAALVRRMERCLLRQQLTEQHGWTREHPAYGAWGMGGPVRVAPDAGHLDISMTRYVLEALAAAPPSEELTAARKAAGVFLARLESRTSPSDTVWGYAFSTVMGEKNKAGMGPGGRYLPYGSATADGVLSELAAGVRPVSVGGRRGPVAWLVAHHRLDRVPALAEGPAAEWGLAMQHYYRAAVAQVFVATGIERAPVQHDWRREMIAAFAAEQRAGGAFGAASGLMKEDDPVIATALAVKALAAALAGP